MTVYVDDARRSLGRMLMAHMLADSEAELLAMVDAIGVDRRHFQGDHFDICQEKRDLAIQHGARPITQYQAAAMRAHRRSMGELGAPEAAEAWFRGRWRRRVA